MIAFWLALAAAAGFAAGHYRLPGRVFERAYDWSQDGRRYSEAVAFVLLVAAFLFTPRRAIRNLRPRWRPEQRQPAPDMDPEWGTR